MATMEEVDFSSIPSSPTNWSLLLSLSHYVRRCREEKATKSRSACWTSFVQEALLIRKFLIHGFYEKAIRWVDQLGSSCNPTVH